MNPRAKVGMIGLRGYGNVVRRGLKECRRLELAAVWSSNPEALERSQKELPCKACASYEALLAEPIRAVLIINPNHLHLPYALPAAEAGKAVLVEKPMTNTVADARRMIAAFLAKGLLLGVKHLARFAPAARMAGTMLRRGDLGKPLSVEMMTSHSTSKTFPKDRWKRDPAVCPAAPLTQLGVHFVDTAMSLFGRPHWVQSRHRNVLGLSENVDCTVTTIGYGETVATLHAHYVVPGYSRFAIYGTEGILIHDDAGLRFKKEGAERFEPVPVAPGDGLVEILDAFGESLLTGAPFETDGDSSLLVVAALEAALRSAAEDGRKVALDEVLAGS